MTLRRLDSTPSLALALLAILALWTWLAAARSGRLEALEVTDTQSFHGAADSDSVTGILSRSRTVAYPLLLRALGHDDDSLRIFPGIHLVFWLAAVVLFWRGLAGWLCSPLAALAIATPLFFAPMLIFLPLITADFLGAAMVVAAYGSLFRTSATSPVRLPDAIALVVAATLAYQLHPSNLSLVATLPAGGFLLRASSPGLRRSAGAFAGKILLCLLIPFLLFSTLRAVLVGHFGIVSFGNVNGAGITSTMLDEQLVSELPPGPQETAARILAVRQRRGSAVATLDTPIGKWEDLVNPAIWGESLPVAFSISQQRAVAKALSELDPDAPSEKRRQTARRAAAESRRSLVEPNRILGEFRRAVLLRRPRLAARWMVLASGQGLLRSLGISRFKLLGAIAGLSWLVFACLRSSPRFRQGSLVSRPALAVTLLCALDFLAKLLLTASTVNPHFRLMVSASLLLPSALVCLAIAPWIGSRQPT